MTTGWLIVNIALAVAVSALVAGVSVLVPLRLDRGASTPGRGTVVPFAHGQTRWAADGRDRAQAA